MKFLILNHKSPDSFKDSEAIKHRELLKFPFSFYDDSFIAFGVVVTVNNTQLS